MRNGFVILASLILSAIHFLKKDGGLYIINETYVQDLILAQNESADNGGSDTSGHCRIFCFPKTKIKKI